MPNYELGPAQILWDASDLGKTQGGIVVNLTETTQTLNTDQDGESPVDEWVTGTQVSITGNLADISLANIASLTKHTVTTDGTKQKVEITSNAGTSLLTNAKVAIVKPYIAGVPTTDANKWITLHTAGMKINTALNYNASDQRVMGFEMVGYADSTGLIATFGDITAT